MRSPRYIATLAGVRELALHGEADPVWWSGVLAPHELELADSGGAAQVVVTGLDARWRGWPFRDLSVVVAARRVRTGETGLFLARAFNASRVMVFWERRWFRLPYAREHVEVRLGDPVGMRLGRGLLDAEMGPRTTEGKQEERTYEGPMFLPATGDESRWLSVRIAGTGREFPFDPARDRFGIAEGGPDPILEGLRASGFRGRTWRLCSDATHARSRTFVARSTG